MIQIQVPLNKVKINEEIHIKYQTIWETQYNTKLIIKDIFLNLQIEPSVKNIQIIHRKTNISKPFCTDLELDIID